MERCPRDWDY